MKHEPNNCIKIAWKFRHYIVFQDTVLAEFITKGCIYFFMIYDVKHSGINSSL